MSVQQEYQSATKTGAVQKSYGTTQSRPKYLDASSDTAMLTTRRQIIDSRLCTVESTQGIGGSSNQTELTKAHQCYQGPMSYKTIQDNQKAR